MLVAAPVALVAAAQVQVVRAQPVVGSEVLVLVPLPVLVRLPVLELLPELGALDQVLVVLAPVVLSHRLLVPVELLRSRR
jgi:hypothetical protein